MPPRRRPGAPPGGARALPADVVAWLLQVFMYVGPAADSVTLAVINGALFSKSPKTRLVLAPQLFSVLQQHGIIEPGMSLRTFLECFDGPQDRTCKVQLDNKEPAHLRVAAQLRVLQAMSAHANCKGLLISAAGAEKALRRAHVNPQLIKALVSHIKNAIPPTVAGQGPVPAAQPQQPQLQGAAAAGGQQLPAAAAAGGQQLPAAAAPEGQQPQQQERFLPLAVTNQSHQLPLTLPDIDKAVVKGIPHFYGLDMYDTHRAAAGIDNIITWATNKMQVDRPLQYGANRHTTADNLRSAILAFMGFVSHYFGLAPESASLVWMADPSKLLAFYAFLMERNVGGGHIEQSIRHHIKVAVYLKTVCRTEDERRHLHQLINWLDILKNQLPKVMPESPEPPPLPPASVVLDFVHRLVNIAVELTKKEQARNDGRVFSPMTCSALRDAVMAVMLFGYSPPVRISSVRTMHHPFVENVPDKCPDRDCRHPDTCKGNRLEVYVDSNGQQQMKMIMPHHKVGSHTISFTVDPVVRDLILVYMKHAHPYLTGGVADQQVPFLLVTDKGRPMRNSDLHRLFIKLWIQHGDMQWHPFPPRCLRHIWAANRLGPNPAPGPSNADAALVMNNSEITWMRYYAPAVFMATSAQAAVDGMQEWRAAVGGPATPPPTLAALQQLLPQPQQQQAQEQQAQEQQAQEQQQQQLPADFSEEEELESSSMDASSDHDEEEEDHDQMTSSSSSDDDSSDDDSSDDGDVVVREEGQPQQQQPAAVPQQVEGVAAEGSHASPTQRNRVLAWLWPGSK